MLSAKWALVTGAVFGFLSVALGAFGAHALKDYLLETNRLTTYETAVQYQMYHALALVLVGIIGLQFPPLRLEWASTLFLAGICIFSGSLYILCASGVKMWGAVTPVGGLCFLAGWLLMAWKLLKV